MNLEFKLPEKCKMTMGQTMAFLVMMAVVTDLTNGQATFAVNNKGKAFNASDEWVSVVSVHVNALVDDNHLQAGFDIFSYGMLRVTHAKIGNKGFENELRDLLEEEGATIS